MVIDTKLKFFLSEALEATDIKINGKRSWDIKVNNPNFYTRVFRDGPVGLGESYMDGEWDCEDIVELLNKYERTNAENNLKVDPALTFKILLQRIEKALLDFFDRNFASRKLASKHYDLSYELYESFLDKRMLYTCGYWENAKNLDEAQEAKLELACKKLGLKKGMRVLDIGGGWGGFAIYAAQRFGVSVLAITISREQLKEAERRRKLLPKNIASRIENRFQDFRDLNDGPYDRVVVMGMIEHIRHENFRKLMTIIKKNLAPDGLFLLHTIGTDKNEPKKGDWAEKYIFPFSEIPSASELTKAYKEVFVMEDWHNFGSNYERTCIEWFKKFDRNWHKIKQKFEPNSERFYRMWKLYLLGSAGEFRARSLQLWQIVFSNGIAGGYKRPIV